MATADDAISFARDIRPLFRRIDLDHMGPMGVLLDDYEYMSDRTNAQAVFDFLVGTRKPRMPIGGPFWDERQLKLFSDWMKNGCHA